MYKFFVTFKIVVYESRNVKWLQLKKYYCLGMTKLSFLQFKGKYPFFRFDA